MEAARLVWLRALKKNDRQERGFSLEANALADLRTRLILRIFLVSKAHYKDVFAMYSLQCMVQKENSKERKNALFLGGGCLFGVPLSSTS